MLQDPELQKLINSRAASDSFTISRLDNAPLLNKVSSLEGLDKSFNFLRKIVLPSNNIKELKPLSNLTELEILNLSNNGVKDITPLANLFKLKNLILSGNDIQCIAS